MTNLTRSYDHLTVLSASGALIDDAALDRALDRLDCLGLPLLELPNTRSRCERFAGSDQDRIMAVQMALKLKQSSLILSTRGGYGLSRILDCLDLNELASYLNAYQHLFVGHSDLTALQLALLSHGAQPQTLLHGPMLCFDFGPECGIHQQTQKWFEQAAMEGLVEVSWQGNLLADSAFLQGEDEAFLSGPAWGGNLSMICSLLGSEFLLAPPAGILILEDVNEPVYKIERMILQLFHAGVLQNQQAIVMGQFAEPKPSQHDAGFDLASSCRFLSEKTGLPIVSNFPFGHVTPKACFFQGAPARLRLTPGSFQLIQQTNVI